MGTETAERTAAAVRSTDKRRSRGRSTKIKITNDGKLESETSRVSRDMKNHRMMKHRKGGSQGKNEPKLGTELVSTITSRERKRIADSRNTGESRTRD